MLLEILGLLGIMLSLVGLHLLWGARRDILFWAEKYLRTFTRLLRSNMTGDSAAPSELGPRTRSSDGNAVVDPEMSGGHHALRLAGGIGLILFGQVLLTAALALLLLDRRPW